MASNNDIKKTLGLINNIKQGSNVELKLQSLAKIKANLTNSESNLKIFKQLCGFKTLCELLKNNANAKVANLVLSILANSAMKPEICKEIVVEHQVLGDVSSILYNIEHPSIHCRAIRLVANVSRTSAYSKYVMRFPFLSRIVSILTNTMSSDTTITCIRAIKQFWLWDQYRVHNELAGLQAIRFCLDKLSLLPASSPSLVLSHLTIVQKMLAVNTRVFIGQMSYLHYEWMVHRLCDRDERCDAVLIQILLKLAAHSKTHFELAKTSLLDQIMSLIWPVPVASPSTLHQLIRILSSLCKENLFRQKIIQSPHAITVLLTYLDTDVIESPDPGNPAEGTRDESMNEDTDEIESNRASTSSSSKPDKSSTLLTNSIHYHILLCVNSYQYDHEGLYRFIRANLIPILMKRLSAQIDKYEYRHGSPVCDQSKYLSTKQSLNMSGNMSPLSPGNMSPQSSSLSPLYLSPNRSPPWTSGAATSTEPGLDIGDNGDDDDTKSVYSPLIEFSDEDAMSSADDNEDSSDVNNSASLAAHSQEERLDVHVIRIMLHISYMKYPFEQLSYKNTWNTLLDYLVNIQQDDCCRNVYKILLIICRKRQFLRALLQDSFILVVHRKLCRMKHGSHCMICSNVMIYGQGIINEISNETNSHYGFSEIMHQYYHYSAQASSSSSDPRGQLSEGYTVPDNTSTSAAPSRPPGDANVSSGTGRIHFMIPYLLKDHPSFQRILFGSDAILSRILSELDGSNQEEAVSCVEELLSSVSVSEEVKRAFLCRDKCASASYEGDITFLLDDGSTVKAHRDLLITKSLYFETMLCGNFKECDQTSNIKLSNISASCLSHLLKLLANYCTCALPRNDIGVFLELIVKSDEYLLHEVNYKLIQLLYAPNALVNASNVHRVYAWSLRYNEFVQACLSNYENFFSKNEFSSPLLLGAKRLKLSDEKRARAGNEDGENNERLDEKLVVKRKENSVGKTMQDELMEKNPGDRRQKTFDNCDENETVDSEIVDFKIADCDSEAFKGINVNETNDRESLRGSVNQIAVIPTSDCNDKAMGKLTLTPLCDSKDEICDAHVDELHNHQVCESVVSKGDINELPNSLMEQPGCSHHQNDETMANIESNSKEKSTEAVFSETVDGNEVASKVENIVDEHTDEPQPCLISDLINEINQNKALLSKPVATCSAMSVQNNIDQDKDKIKNILLLKNEPSFKLRKIPLAGKRKARDKVSTSAASSPGSREHLNVHLIKLMFNTSRNYSSRKSVEVVRNIIDMSRSRESADLDDNIFEQFKQDLFDLIHDTLK